MVKDLIFALWFFLPAGVANLTPILIAQIKCLKKYEAPMDFSLTFRGKRVFGAHKTWRGFISGVIAATLILYLQKYCIVHFDWFTSFKRSVDYASLQVLVVGPLFGIGALGGDAVESFLKRQRSIVPGGSWFPFDQTDYIIGGALAIAPFISLHIWQYIWLIGVWLVVHIVASTIGYLLGIKDRPI
jgi:CDP-2,3-bis-(O-geranylgeranyl)-sn-glycerol synthase